MKILLLARDIRFSTSSTTEINIPNAKPQTIILNNNAIGGRIQSRQANPRR